MLKHITNENAAIDAFCSDLVIYYKLISESSTLVTKEWFMYRFNRRIYNFLENPYA